LTAASPGSWNTSKNRFGVGKRGQLIIQRLVWRVQPFSYYSSGDYNIDRRNHGVTPFYLFVSKIFTITLQDR
jgi:hypothetical protein